jgi:hypothetical protein
MKNDYSVRVSEARSKDDFMRAARNGGTISAQMIVWRANSRRNDWLMNFTRRRPEKAHPLTNYLCRRRAKDWNADA